MCSKPILKVHLCVLLTLKVMNTEVLPVKLPNSISVV